MKLIRLHIKKKTLVPTKHQIIHEFRSDWKHIYTITPDMNFEFLMHIKNDAQLACWLRDNFGVGEYSLIFWGGGEGFKRFCKLKCNEETYQRLRKVETPEQKE